MMSIQTGAVRPDYSLCRYGRSRSLFRGPQRDVSGDYVAVLGGSATFGKYIEVPFPALLEQAVGQPVVNLGALNAGPDFFLTDPAVLDVAARARVAVVQITGAEALSNPFYNVHSRRNDRFLAATPALRDLFPEVDFTEIHFTCHLLTALASADPDRFDVVVQALRSNWLARMRELLVHLPPRRLLLWLGECAPPSRADRLDPVAGPLLVDTPLLAALGPVAGEIVEVWPLKTAGDHPPLGSDLLRVEAVARGLPGPGAHSAIARHLSPRVAALLGTGRPAPLVLRNHVA
jgi:Domain of unknown function (DUF6473)